MNEEIGICLEEFFREEEERQKQLREKYPPDPPNEICHFAFVKGLSIENSFKPVVGEFNYLLSTPNEKVFVWTHEKDKNSGVIIDVNPDVKNLAFWKSLLSVIRLALAYSEAFEQGFGSDNVLEYKWVYYFNSKATQLDKAVIYNTNEMDQKYITDGRIIKATELANLAPEIELLLRDDKAYTAMSMLNYSFSLHYICLTCEISDHPYHDHLSEEPELWERADIIQSMEAAIVQACRSVESILGEPPSTKNQNALLRHKNKWNELIGINPDDQYSKANMSYLEFYYDLFFDLRNPSAHSYGNIHYDLKRAKTIQAQCFAALVVRGYMWRHIQDIEIAKAKLNFNEEFLSRVSPDMSTKLTK